MPRYREVVTPAFIRLIGISSALHDIGKVGIEDAVLLKPGKLDTDERSRMQCHAAVGGECIRQIELRLGSSNFLQMAREIAYYHHERWDGEGYPTGLKETDIPLAARIVAVADVYDALSVRRVYKEAFPHEKCVNIIREQAGKQFDPSLVEVFLKIEAEFADIARRFSNEAAIRVEKTLAQKIEEELECPTVMNVEEEETLKSVMRMAVEVHHGDRTSNGSSHQPQASAS